MVGFDAGYVRELLGKREIFNARKVIFTGDTVGLAAAQCACPLFRAKCGIFMGCSVVSAIDLALFSSKKSVGAGEPDSPWIIAVSEKAQDACLLEALERVRAFGAFTLLVTCAQMSEKNKAVDRVLTVCRGPAEEPFLALCRGLTAVACRIADTKRQTPPLVFERTAQAWGEYADGARSSLRAQKKTVAQMGARWSACTAFEAIGDEACCGAARYTGLGVARKYAVPFFVYDSEEWCHVPFFVRDSQKTSTLFFRQSASASVGRVAESITMALHVERPVDVITDLPTSDIPGTNTLLLPAAPETFPWMFAFFAASAANGILGEEA